MERVLLCTQALHLRYSAARRSRMKRAVVRSQISFGMFVGLALLVANNVIGCGDSSSSDTPDTSIGNNTPGGAGSTGARSANGGGSSTSGTPNSEGNPNNVSIQVDP